MAYLAVENKKSVETKDQQADETGEDGYVSGVPDFDTSEDESVPGDD